MSSCVKYEPGPVDRGRWSVSSDARSSSSIAARQRRATDRSANTLTMW